MMHLATNRTVNHRFTDGDSALTYRTYHPCRAGPRGGISCTNCIRQGNAAFTNGTTKAAIVRMLGQCNFSAALTGNDVWHGFTD
jgi:hypothetical protein